MRPDVSHIGLAVDTGDGGSCRRPPLGGRTRLVNNNINWLSIYYYALLSIFAIELQACDEYG